jgi:polar amino acid transport system substrate-binding protein
MWHLPDRQQRADAPRRARRGRQVSGLAAMATAGVLVLAACGGGGGGGGTSGGGGSLSQFKKNGITVGFANEKPFDYQSKSGKVTGEAPTLARYLLGKLGIKKLNFKVVDFNGLVPGLQKGHFDMTAAGAAINPKRAKKVLYADPDYCVGEALAVKKGNPKNLSDYKSVKKNSDAKLAVESGAVEAQFAKQIGIPSNRIVTFSNNQALVSAVKGGRADAFSLTENTVRDLVKTSGGGKLQALQGFTPVINGKPQTQCGGFQFSKSNKALRDAFNKQLHSLQQAGDVYSVVKKGSPNGDAFGFTKKQFKDATKHTAKELGGGNTP